MRKSRLMIFVPAVVLAAACGRKSNSAIDDGLKNDLALASQAQVYTPNISATEAGLGAQPQLQPQALQTSARQPVSTAPVRHTSTRRSSSGSRASSSAGNGGYYPAPAPPPVTVEKLTQRDAAIGAA